MSRQIKMRKTMSVEARILTTVALVAAVAIY
jgi:hypothetical protein